MKPAGPEADAGCPTASRRRRDVRAGLRRGIPAAFAGVGLALVLAVNEHLRAGAMLVPSAIRSWALLFVLLMTLATAAAYRVSKSVRVPARGRLRAGLPAAILLACGVGFLFSGAMLHPWSYFIDWLPDLARGSGTLKTGLPWFILFTAAATPLMARRCRGLWRGLFLLLAVAQIAIFVTLLRSTGGVAFYRDDHPSFMFRLWEFSRTFPQYLNYNPWWNGGAVNAYCTSSGTGALGLPLFLLWRFAPVHTVYTAGVGLVYIVAMPLLAVAALRIMGATRTAAACAGLLALGVSRHFFLWLLHYGTVCAPLVAAFVLLVAACLYRVFWLNRREIWLAATLVLSVVMLLQWPPGGLMAIPLAVTCLTSFRRWSWKKIRFVSICAGIVLLLCFRQLLVILLKGGTVVTHVMGTGSGAQAVPVTESITKGFNYLVAHLQEGHPLLLFLGLAGLCVLSARAVRHWFGPALLCFALIVGWGAQVKPNLELGRMAIPMLFLAVGPAAVVCARLLRTADWRLAPARAALVVLLGLGAWNVGRLYGNQGRAAYSVMPPEIHDFAARLRTEVPEGGRVMFAGPTVHYFGRGHVAYLPYLTGREMMAVDYYHFPITYVPYEYPPAGFNESPAAVREFIRLYNITHVVTYRERWLAFFRERLEEYEVLEGVEALGASVFRVRRDPSPFLEGAGRVTATFNRLDVQVADPTGTAVLCYNWVDGLSADAPVEVFPYDAGHGVRLIGVRPNGLAAFRIRYRSLL